MFSTVIVLFFSISIKAQESGVKIPKKAALYSAIIPGAGQIYTKKYWKVPIIYGGLITSVYFIKDNQDNYNMYKEAALTSIENNYENLFLVGRNGMHKYNNQDHSMLTAMTAVENIINNVKTKDNIWLVNTEKDYHEKK